MISGKSWLNPKLKISESKAHGKGVFAVEKIKKDERLAIFGGSVMLIDDVKNLPKGMESFPLQIEERFVFGNVSSVPEEVDYFNHCCDPNSGINGQIFLVAMRDIMKGEEITFDYAMNIAEAVGSDSVFEMDCKCGSENCRKKVTERDWRIPELRKKYKGYFSEYIRQRIISGNQ
jgi:uncharacterized protein